MALKEGGQTNIKIKLKELHTTCIFIKKRNIALILHQLQKYHGVFKIIKNKF